jgi:hypothetical protein
MLGFPYWREQETFGLNADEGDPWNVTSSTRCFTGTVVSIGFGATSVPAPGCSKSNSAPSPSVETVHTAVLSLPFSTVTT